MKLQSLITRALEIVENRVSETYEEIYFNVIEAVADIATQEEISATVLKICSIKSVKAD